jgi:hypothetical protein
MLSGPLGLRQYSHCIGCSNCCSIHMHICTAVLLFGHGAGAAPADLQTTGCCVSELMWKKVILAALNM